MTSTASSRAQFIYGILLSLILAGVGWNLSILSEIKSDMNIWIERTTRVETQVKYNEFDVLKVREDVKELNNRMLKLEAIIREEKTFKNYADGN